MKHNLIKDLKQLWSDIKSVYPVSFAWLTNHWGISIAAVVFIISSFYLDPAIRSLFIGINNKFIDHIFTFGRWYGSGQPTLYLFGGLYLTGLLLRYDKIRDTGLLVGITYCLSGILTLIFKSTCGRWRPYTGKGDLSFDGWNLTGNDQFSYFSGHAQVGFALTIALAAYIKNKYLKILLYMFAVICALSRIYHDQHWWSDVITGSLIAILISHTIVRFHLEKAVPGKN
jgi:membrane-associated phospholipid phosphatase